jgi:hypothetical protein
MEEEPGEIKPAVTITLAARETASCWQADEDALTTLQTSEVSESHQEVSAVVPRPWCREPEANAEPSEEPTRESEIAPVAAKLDREEEAARERAEESTEKTQASVPTF